MAPLSRSTHQHTLAASAVFEGVGLHSGAPARMAVHPAEVGSGISFVRVDLPGMPRILARADRVNETKLGTVISEGSASVRTIEHVMAALAIVGVDNAVIDLDGPEAPILDGSALAFVERFDSVGLRTQDCARSPLLLSAAVEVRDGDRYIRATPIAADEGSPRELHVSIAFADAAIGAQAVVVNLDDPVEIRHYLARARTFARRHEIETLHAAGFARGGSLENAIIVDDAKILNEGGLRFDKEFAWHKALDLVGDMALLGVPLISRVSAHKCGHDLNNKFVRKLLKLRADV